jgi:DNA-binding LytR/AlgR family response regulator
MRILAVDDRPEGLARMETLARELSPEAELLSSASSLEALGMARKAEIDVALLRVDTPELGGLDLGRYLIELNPLVNLIYVSEDEQHGFEAMDIHASGYMLEPFGQQALKRELEDLRHLHYQDMKNAVLEELDRRNGGLGTCWHNAYYVYQMWVRDDAVMVEIGNSSD